jgi:small subunit ribosomal protein S18
MKKQQQEQRIRYIDYKDVEFLGKHLNPHGRMKAAKHTRFDAVTQRAFANAVKRARFMGLLPYVQK